MAIHNLSGNFQPPSVETGSRLPQPSSRAPSTAKVDNDGLKVVANTETNSNTIQSVAVNQNEKPTENQAEVKSQIEEFQSFNQSIDRSLQFKVDEELGVTIVRVVDKETDELIRQFPPEELINLSKRLKELNEEDISSSGILLQEKV
ncbi:flagellar protein FlaG [Aliikangiella coralliicola]|uniref:Flagellar protein FlaG n=1 Tax=Aliikangiella coralliicola TaxID=2592383 RepID=A0A545U5V3_9GAMM|nr:flagellar protein FlaG [Aliikangiella coralliicola]TQV84850.1 flagellar protein FlaG [Aliikangiella coralliicola]